MCNLLKGQDERLYQNPTLAEYPEGIFFKSCICMTKNEQGINVCKGNKDSL